MLTQLSPELVALAAQHKADVLNVSALDETEVNALFSGVVRTAFIEAQKRLMEEEMRSEARELAAETRRQWLLKYIYRGSSLAEIVARVKFKEGGLEKLFTSLT
jgi:hypothetical protein